MSKPPLPHPDQSLPFLLLRARETVMAPIRQMLSETGLTEQQWRILRVLAQFGPQDASGLADRACLQMSSVTRITRTMEARGLIALIRDSQDRRRQRIAIAEAGSAIISENQSAAEHIAAGFQERLGAKDYAALLGLLSRFNAADDPDA